MEKRVLIGKALGAVFLLTFLIETFGRIVREHWEPWQDMGKKSGKFSMKIDKKELDGLTNNEFRISLMFILEMCIRDRTI